VWGGGGLKDDFEGHSNSWANNVVALDTNPALHNGYDGTVGTPGNVPYVKEGFEQLSRLFRKRLGVREAYLRRNW
jgi:hypothetical protein